MSTKYYLSACTAIAVVEHRTECASLDDALRQALTYVRPKTDVVSLPWRADVDREGTIEFMWLSVPAADEEGGEWFRKYHHICREAKEVHIESEKRMHAAVLEERLHQVAAFGAPLGRLQ